MILQKISKGKIDLEEYEGVDQDIIYFLALNAADGKYTLSLGDILNFLNGEPSDPQFYEETFTLSENFIAQADDVIKQYERMIEDVDDLDFITDPKRLH